MPGEFRFLISGESGVRVLQWPGVQVFELREVRAGVGLSGRLRRKFAFVDPAGDVVLELGRLSRQPYGRFEMVSDAAVIGGVDCVNLLRTRYRISLLVGQCWSFHMPLFSAAFRATTESGESVQVRMLRENMWTALVPAVSELPQLLAALALILSSRWTSS